MKASGNEMAKLIQLALLKLTLDFKIEEVVNRNAC
jgi:hypothetical protein